MTEHELSCELFDLELACRMKSRFDEVFLNPQANYEKPQLVLEDVKLSREEKVDVLKKWKAEAIHMQESTAEGFDGGERSHLDEVAKALHELEP